MPYTVIVSFARDRQYEFKFHDTDNALLNPVAAQEWLGREWIDLECEPTNLVGKILRLDMVLLIAKNAGEKRFAERGEWAQSYARAVVGVLGRNTVHVNVAEHQVG